jgi:biopolymer transport protein ExbD
MTGQVPQATGGGASGLGPGGGTGGGGPTTLNRPKASVVKFKAALRRAKRRNAREPEIDFLNITAMLDLMTIILVFVLKSLSTSQTAQSDDLKLPVSVLTSEPSEEGVVVTISKTQLLVGDDTTPLAKLSSPEQLAQTGLDAQYKRSGPNDLFIVPLAKVLGDYRDRDKLIRAAKGLDASTSEAIVVADATTPYRVLIEVLFTLGASEFGKYHLMVVSGKKG